MKKILSGVIAGLLVCTGATETTAVPQGTQKILLKISTVECPGTRARKALDLPPLPLESQTVPYSEAEMARATPQKASYMADANAAARRENQKIQAAAAYHNWAQADKHMRGLREQLYGTQYGRQLLMGIDKFAGIAGQKFDSQCIEFFHRMDNDEGAKEKFLQDMGDPATLACAYFIKLVFDDPRRETGKIVMNGQQMSRTKLTIALTYQVQNLSGKIAASGNIRCEKTIQGTDAVSREGREENVIVDLLEECMAKAAQQINDFFVAKVVFKAVSAQKKDEDFDDNGATLEIDGVTRQLGEEVSLIKGNHIVKVDLDGYKQKGSTFFKIDKAGTKKIVMIPTTCKLTVVVKGNGNPFDASSAVIELVSGENTENLSADTEATVKKGKYQLKVSMDGYASKQQTVNLSQSKQKIVVQLQKLNATAK